MVGCRGDHRGAGERIQRRPRVAVGQRRATGLAVAPHKGLPVAVGHHPGGPEAGRPGQIPTGIPDAQIIDIDEHIAAGVATELSEMKVAVRQRDRADRERQKCGRTADDTGDGTPVQPVHTASQPRGCTVRNREAVQRFPVQPREQCTGLRPGQPDGVLLDHLDARPPGEPPVPHRFGFGAQR